MGTRWSRAGLRLILALGAALAASCSASRAPLPPPRTAASVDLSRYAGTWYEIARLPASFQEGCAASRATYSLLPDGRVKVLNECRDGGLDKPWRKAVGKAKVVDKATNARLKVSFFWPFYGDYWILELDPDYRHVLVGTPDRRYLWILSRTPRLDEAVYRRLVERAAAEGYDTGRLIMTSQPQS